MKHFFKILVALLLTSISLHAQDDLPSPMSPPRLVNDFANIFSDSQKADLENMLRNYADTTSTQIYVVSVATLNGYDVSDYAARLGEKWGIGQKDKNNGVLILIKPRIGNERGRVFIATGYGVEHILTDARCGRILDQAMIPHLPDNYYAGTKESIERIISYLSGEFKDDEGDGEDSIPALIFNVLLFIAIFCVIYFVVKRGGGNGGNSGGRRGGGYGGYGGFGGGGFGGGSSGGGGGFSGGGGGSFGGGGAGRSF